jgi:NAD-dependent deacetylase
MSLEIPPSLVTLLRTCQHVTALTGAGVSQESGVPTFRDSLDGLWEKYRPEDLATPQAFLRNPQLVWDWYAMRRAKVDEVKPNPGHTALVEMSRHHPHFTLITQNVDGLHQRAGSPQVIELHGNIKRVKCFRCGRLASDWAETGSGVPTCSSCGNLLRPDVVWFGEGLPPDAMQAAEQAARSCQLFFSIGTSGVVYPAASLAHTAVRHGAAIMEINAESTPLTPYAQFHLPGRSGQILPALVTAAWG